MGTGARQAESTGGGPCAAGAPLSGHPGPGGRSRVALEAKKTAGMESRPSKTEGWGTRHRAAKQNPEIKTVVESQVSKSGRSGAPGHPPRFYFDVGGEGDEPSA